MRNGGRHEIDVAVVNGTVIRSDGRHPLDIGVRDGTVVACTTRGGLPQAKHVVDAQDKWILPGLIDTHFHCRTPDRPDREDFASGTAAAAAGGVTTIFEMPISTPAVSTPEVLLARKELAEDQACIDVGLYAAPGDLDRPRLDEMADVGAVAFKLMMHAAPDNREASFAGLTFPEDDDIYRALELVQETGLVCAVHAESQHLIDVFEAREMSRGRSSPMSHARSRPDVAEALAIARLGALNERVGAKIHIVHVSSALATEYIRWFQERGQSMTAETTPAYLLADEGDIETYGPFVKINPPLRTARDREILWQALHRETLNLVVSDHSPFLPDEKEPGWTDIWNVGSGIPGVELTGRLMWHEALSGRIAIESVAAWCSENPARLFGLGPNKGVIREGADADFVIFDPNVDTVLTEERLFSRSKGSIRHVLGKTLRGDIVSVWSHGRIVFQDGRVTAEPGSGRVIRPTMRHAEQIPERDVTMKGRGRS